MPFADPRHHHEIEELARCPLAGGLIYAMTNYVEHPELVAQRPERAAWRWATVPAFEPGRTADQPPRPVWTGAGSRGVGEAPQDGQGCEDRQTATMQATSFEFAAEHRVCGGASGGGIGRTRDGTLGKEAGEPVGQASLPAQAPIQTFLSPPMPVEHESERSRRWVGPARLDFRVERRVQLLDVDGG